MLDLTKIEGNVVTSSLKGKNFLFFGEPGTRKTTVASHFPRPIFAATDDGFTYIPGLKGVVINDWPTFKQFAAELARPEVKAMYDTVVIDVAGLLYKMVVKYVCATKGVKEIKDIPWGGGWSLLDEQFADTMQIISRSGYGIVFLAHRKFIKDNEGNVEDVIPEISNRGTSAITALCDYVMFLQKIPVMKDGVPITDANGVKQCTVIARHDVKECKTRARYLNNGFEFTYGNLCEEIGTAIKKEMGAIDDSTRENFYTIEAITTVAPIEHISVEEFEAFRDETVALATELLNNPSTKEQTAELLVAIMKGVQLSKSTVADFEKVKVLKTALLDVK